MKTFEQVWLSIFSHKKRLDQSLMIEVEHIAKELWETLNLQWRAFIENVQPLKSFEEFLKMNDREQHYSSFEGAAALTAWDFQDKQWRHVVANKLMAIQLKDDDLKILQKKNEELERDLRILIRWELEGADNKSDEIVKGIIKRHKLDEVNS